MKSIVNDRGLIIYEFEDNEKEIVDKFCRDLYINDSKEYVIERMMESMGNAIVADIVNGKLRGNDIEDNGSDVLGITVVIIAELRAKCHQERSMIWQLAYEYGLPKEGDWCFNKVNRQFNQKNKD